MTDESRPTAPGPRVYRRRRFLAAGIAVVVLVSTGLGIVALLSPVEISPQQSAGLTTPTTAAATPTPVPTPTVEVPRFDKAKHSIDDPMSIWIVANKLRPLNPKGFVPPDMVTANVRYAANATLRAEAAAAMERMFTVAAQEGAGGMMVQNAYRSFDTQVGLYAGHVNRLGQAQADIASARAGHSEHQTGLSADIMPDTGSCGGGECFAQTSQGIWLVENAWRFGYHLRYPQGKTNVTGYAFEPWHYRYVGVELSTELHQQGYVTLEEFFGLPAAPTYG